MTDPYDFLELPDLASRAFAGSVVAANDELFAGARRTSSSPGHRAHPRTSATKGRSTSWLTRRRREPGTTGPWSASESRAFVVSSSTPATSPATTHRRPRSREPRSTATPIRVTSSTGYPCWLLRPGRDSPNAFAVSSPARSRTCGCRSTRTVASPGSASTASAARTPSPHRHHRPGGDRERWTRARLLQPLPSSPSNILLPGRTRTMGEGWRTPDDETPATTT